uniref:guanylate cyclase n=1 Tax=Serinus canaria TaxID=9135 RepID=A0A8C9MHS0_SERCA
GLSHWDFHPLLRELFHSSFNQYQLKVSSSETDIIFFIFHQMTDWIHSYARNLKEKTEDLKRERRLAEDLLHQMLPKSVAKQLRRCQKVEAENYDQVTIFFSDIVGFTSIAASCTPLQVVEMLNNLYVCFDTRIESYDVYKVMIPYILFDWLINKSTFLTPCS